MYANRSLKLRAATPDDRPFAQQVYFETQRHLIEKLFGWRGNDVEQSKFAESYDESRSSIVEIDGDPIGWLTVRRGTNNVEIAHIYIVTEKQRQGLGTHLLRQLIVEAEAEGKTLTISTAKINRARRLYERLGFVNVRESKFKVDMVRAPKNIVGAIEIREETRSDILEIRAVHDAAFERSAEGRLVERLRDDDLIAASIVAVESGQVVGNAVFSRLSVEGLAQPQSPLALAPVAVAPRYQSRGIGSSIIRYGLAVCAQRGYPAVVVLGDPQYYARFGFSSDLAARVRSPYSNAGRHWMALELRESILSSVTCDVAYPPAFREVDQT